MGICYVVGALKTGYRINKKEDDCVIAADLGYHNLGGVRADLVVGDFDSLGFVPEGENIIRYPEQKDETDTLLAVKIGLEKGYVDFIVAGGIGGRLDHTFANFQTLAFLATKNAKGILVGDAECAARTECAAMIKNGAAAFLSGAEGAISVFAFGGTCRGVTLEGLKYPLKDAVLKCDYPLGVSNAFTGAPSKVEIADGAALLIWQGGPELITIL